MAQQLEATVAATPDKQALASVLNYLKDRQLKVYTVVCCVSVCVFLYAVWWDCMCFG